MYENFGYSVFRRVREYYGNLGVGKGGRDEEDAFGMCSACLALFSLFFFFCLALFAPSSIVFTPFLLSLSVATGFHFTMDDDT